VSKATILVVDDERLIRWSLRQRLEEEGHRVIEAADGEAALEQFSTGVDTVLLDYRMPGLDGLQVLERMRGEDPDVPVIMLTAHSSVEHAVSTMRAGAFHYAGKPFDLDEVSRTVSNALETNRLRREVRSLRAARGEAPSLAGIIGDSPAMSAVKRLLARIAQSPGSTVLITGESGTGKDLAARAVHAASTRKDGPFLNITCSALPENLLESELFGHERGAFTGATGLKRGLFEVANAGTIFLDEIGDMDVGAQAKVLRVLQSGELMRVGGERPIKVDVRVLAATHRNLKDLVATGDFREDLYFRLNVVPIDVPPLRDRDSDVTLLCRHYIDIACRENGMTSKPLSPETLAVLTGYSWPGNVRELRNVMERMAILSDTQIEVADIPEDIRSVAAELAQARPDAEHGDVPTTTSALIELLGPLGEQGIPDAMSLKSFREAVERAFIRQRLGEHGWNVSRTAEALGVERTHLHKKMKVLGITRGQA